MRRKALSIAILSLLSLVGFAGASYSGDSSESGACCGPPTADPPPTSGDGK